MANRGDCDSPLLLPHLLKGIGKIKRANLLGILKLEKLVSAVTSHVHQDIAPVVGEKALASWHLGADAIGQQADKVLDGDLVAAVVDLDVVAVEVDGAIRVAVDGPGEGVAGVAGHVVGEHQDDLGVGDAEALDGSVHGEDIGEVAVVEPESRRADEDGPVAGMLGEDGGCEQCRRHEGVESKRGQVHDWRRRGMDG